MKFHRQQASSGAKIGEAGYCAAQGLSHQDGGTGEYGKGSGSANGSGSGRTPCCQGGCNGIGKSPGPAISGVAIEAFGGLLFGRYAPGPLQATAGEALLAAAVMRLQAFHHQRLRQGDAFRRGSGARSGDSAGGSLWERTWGGLLEMLGSPDAASPPGPALPSESHAPKMLRRQRPTAKQCRQTRTTRTATSPLPILRGVATLPPRRAQPPLPLLNGCRFR